MGFRVECTRLALRSLGQLTATKPTKVPLSYMEVYDFRVPYWGPDYRV